MKDVHKQGTKIVLGRGLSGGGGGSSESVSFTVTDPGHGYVQGDLPLAMFHTSTGWEEAIADAEYTLATHVMVGITDVDHYTLAQTGRFSIPGHGLLSNNYYFVSDTTAGKFTDTEPNIYSNPLLFIEDTDYIHVLQFRPSISGEGLIDNISSTDAEIDGGSFSDTGTYVLIDGGSF